MRIAMLGATNGCSFEALTLLLQEGGSEMEVHALARNKEAFLAKLATQSLDHANRLYIHSGDALDSKSVQLFFDSTSQHGHIDYVVSSLGGLPQFSMRSPLSIKLAPGMENICSDSIKNILNSLEAIAPRQDDKKAPSLIVVSSNGMGKSSHDVLPALLKPFYNYVLYHPHEDKRKMEKVLHTRYGIPSVDFHGPARLLEDQKGATLDKNRLTILRPSIFTNGPRKNTVRTSRSTLPSAWTISRKDVGAYIANICLRNGEGTHDDRGKRRSGEWQGGIVLSY